MTVWDLPYRLGNNAGGLRPFYAPFYFTGHVTQEGCL
jgi:hypothetical protein